MFTQQIAPIYPVYAYDENGNRIYDEEGNTVHDFGYVPTVHVLGRFP